MHEGQPVLWYELHGQWPGATLRRLHEVGGFGRKAAIRALLRESGARNVLHETKNSKAFAAERIEKLRGRARSALKKRKPRAQVLRVVLVSQR